MSTATETLNGEAIQDGLYPGMPRQQYERIEAANYSTLKLFRKSAAHAREAMLHPKEPSDEMDFGTAFHAAILEPAKFAAEYIAAPKVDRRTKAGQAVWAEFEDANRGKAILAADDMEKCQTMAKAAWDNELVKGLLSAPGKNEVAVVWTDAITGQRCKALLDRICKYGGWTILPDIKTCADAAPWAFAQQVARYAYYEQAAFYLDGLNAVGRADRRWLWVACEKERPYCVAVYEPDQDSLEQGSIDYRTHLKAYQHCMAENLWPGYPAEMRRLRLPRWAFSETE